MPSLRVAFLQGAEAKKAWVLAVAARPDLERIPVVATYHPGRQALFHPDPIERTRRAAHRQERWQEVALLLNQ